ncbi:MAG: DUF1343 domain-containing protein [Alphaproteobacteria bacterium]|nr:DUF1343 domain-containing protein [Alphaproteobacteria bacterium]
MTITSISADRSASRVVLTGADILVASGFDVLKGKRVGLITNPTGLVGASHLADLMHEHDDVELVAILGPEHGFRGAVEAGEKVRDGVDPKTGVPVFSIYGKTRKPTQKMLKGIDVLVFDIQDIGTRFYTYISTMGLAMQAAAEAGIEFVVLDRPNPLGGQYVSGFVLEPRYESFVGQYPIPVVHGLTVGELAEMIKGEAYLPGLADLNLQVIGLKGWSRSMRWPDTGRAWVATSPNIPTFRSALVYPGIGIVGESKLANEGRGTAEPFTIFGAPWLDAKSAARRLNGRGLPGVVFAAERYRPRSIPGIAKSPLFMGRMIGGVRIKVTDINRYQPLEVGVHAMSELVRQARRKKVSRLFGDVAMFRLIAGTRRLQKMLLNGASGGAIVASWSAEVARFRGASKRYHLY